MRSVIVFLIFSATAFAVKSPIDLAKDFVYETRYRELADKSDWMSIFNRAEIEDTHLLVPEIVRKYGYPLEDHFVTTPDGYVLNVHRIPYGRKSGPSENRPVVFLMHGILQSSADWIIAGPEKGFAYILVEKGYDVWMGNARGNRYSKKHVSLPNDSKEFWDFSWHEIGVTDLPTMIDYALQQSGQEKLFYAGHSQGTTSFYVMASERPEYNQKIRAHFSLAPVAYMKHMTSPLLRFMALFDGPIELLLEMIGMYEFLPTDGFLHNITQGFCDEGILQIVCTNTLFVLCGYNEAQMNTTLLPVLMGHTPAGASTKQMLHYSQLVTSGKFRQYDYGKKGNEEKYGNKNPPNYDLGKVSAPLYLLYSKNDWLAAVDDVLKLYQELGNVQGKFLVADDKWNHMDYMWGIDADKLVYQKVISLMTRH